jgi:N6-L-threonylcarbamoyladenine synthase
MLRKPLKVLGLETSCDETAAAVVRGYPPGPGLILSNITYSQIAEHRPYGGVVPEIAARAHVELIDGLITRALAAAELNLGDMDAVAATAGPGLIGGVMVGLTSAKALALAAGKPLIAVNHLEAHALSARLCANLEFPFLLLLISGGHCELVEAAALGRYRRYGATIDDAVGECFDKVAKLLGLPYPGGPQIEKLARSGVAKRVPLPRPMIRREGADFSFSGLKTAVRRIALERDPLDARDRADLAASIELAICEALCDRTANAIAWFRRHQPEGRSLVVAGGVAANIRLRHRLAALAHSSELDFVAPPEALCTDNAAMIAWAGVERLRLGLVDGLDAAPRPRWPLDATAPPRPGAGVKA